MKKLQRLLSFVLTLCMITGLFPALAVNTNTDSAVFFCSVKVGNTTYDDLEKVSDTIYILNRPQKAGTYSIIDSEELGGVTFNLRIPENKKIEKVWTSRQDEFAFQDSALTPDEQHPERKNLNLEECLTRAHTGNGHQYAGCVYIQLDDGTIYTLIDNYIPFGIANWALPSWFALYDDTKKEYLSETFQRSDMNNPEACGSTVVRADLSMDHPAVLRAEVENTEATTATDKNLYITTITMGGINWTEAAENWVILNGERMDPFFCSDNTSHTYSAPFALKPGLNVVEVCSNSGGFMNGVNNKGETGYEWFSRYNYFINEEAWADKTASVVYLIDYKGDETAALPEKSGDATLRDDLLRAYYMTDNYDYTYNGGKNRANVKKSILKKTGENTYAFNAPIANKTAPSKPKSAYLKAAFLSLVPNDPEAKVEILDPTEDGSLVSGEQIGTVHAVNLFQLGDDNTLTVKVTSANGKTTKEYKFQVVFASSSTDSAISVEGAKLDTEFDVETLDYYLDFPEGSSSATITITPPEGGTAQVDGKEYTGPAQLSAEEDFHTVTITAADTVTTKEYYFVTRLADGTIPFYTYEKDTKEQAYRMLSKNWYPVSQAFPNVGSPWVIFMTAAAGNGVLDENGVPGEYDYTGRNVYDVRNSANRQATDPARDILQIILLGENPYNFDPDGTGNGINFVERLEGWKSGGPYANNIWYLMAAKAVGIDPVFEQWNKDYGLDKSNDLDMRSWAIAAVSDLPDMEQKNLVRYIDRLRDKLFTPEHDQGMGERYWGDIIGYGGGTNSFTRGCFYTAVASTGADLDHVFRFEYNGKTYAPLDTLENTFFSKAGGFLTVPNDTPGMENDTSASKDQIIGLGDILHGSNLWTRERLTADKYDGLIAKAKTYAAAETSNETAKAAQTVMTETLANMTDFATDSVKYGTYASGYGKNYFTLYEAVADYEDAVNGKSELRPQVNWGMPYEKFAKHVKELIDSGVTAETLQTEDLEKIESLIQEYEAMDEVNQNAVADSTMEQYRALVSAALKLKETNANMSNTVSDWYDRVQALPDPLVAEESDRAEVEKLREIYNHLESDKSKDLDEKRLAEWAGESVLIKLQKVEAALGTSGGGSDKPQRMTIHFKLYGDKPHGDNGQIHTLKAGNLDLWLEKDYTFNAKSVSAETAFKIIMGKEGIAWRGNDNNSYDTLYISGIQNPTTKEWMEEFTTTANSGWMYTVNGRHPNVGVSNYTIANGDTFILHYTDDYTQEEGSEAWSSGGSSSSDVNAGDQKAANTVIDQIKSIGTVTKDSGDKIKAARDAYDKLTEAQKKLVTNYGTLTDAERAYAGLTGKLPFTDVNGHWAYDAIKYAYENSLFAGTSATTFGPNVSMNRAMLVTVLYRLDKEPSAETTSSFKDVPAGQWYTKAVAWASANKIVSGYNADTFGPTDTITREQMASILYRYAQYKGYDISKTTDLAAFTDKASISDWALTSMQWANAEKLINGRTTTTLVPQGNATRAEVAQILMTFAETVIK